MINLQQRGMRGSVRVKGRETLLSVPQRCLKAPLTPFIVEDSRGILDRWPRSTRGNPFRSGMAAKGSIADCRDCESDYVGIAPAPDPGCRYGRGVGPAHVSHSAKA